MSEFRYTDLGVRSLGRLPYLEIKISLRYHGRYRKYISWLLSNQTFVCLRSFSIDREGIASCHATSSCVTASAYSSNFDLRSCDLAEINTDGTFVFLFPGLSSKKPVQEKARGRRIEGVQRANCILYHAESRRKPHCLPRGPRLHRNLEYLWRSLRRTLSSMGEREVPASFGFVSKAEPREILCCWDLGYSGP